MTISKYRASYTQAPRVLVLEGGISGGGGVSRCVRRAGGEVLAADPRDRRAVADALSRDPDALVLTGGGDVDPARYRARYLSRYTYGVNEDRDRNELEALDLAGDLGIPVLGICRGMQLMNVHAGGSLLQDLPTSKLGAAGLAHQHRMLPVQLEPRTLMAHSLKTLRTPVMHLHHQAVRNLGAGFRVSARHADGTIEGIESTTGNWWVGAQFHPEYASRTAPEAGLFEQLVFQAANAAGLVQWTPAVPPRLDPAKLRVVYSTSSPSFNPVVESA